MWSDLKMTMENGSHHLLELCFVIVHVILFVTGFIGNTLVCVAVYRNTSMRTVTNYFIVNLAVADLIVIVICLPPTTIFDITHIWYLGDVACRIVLFVQSLVVTVSVLTLSAISVDRWYAICFPIKFKSTTKHAKTAIFIIWLISLLCNVPEFIIHKEENLKQCTSPWSVYSDPTWHMIKVLFLYTFPLVLMIIAYCQMVRVLRRSDDLLGDRETRVVSQGRESAEGQLESRRKAANMLIAVVFTFAVCYTPLHLLTVFRVFKLQQKNLMTGLVFLSHVMCYANSAINPFIYNYMNGKPQYILKFVDTCVTCKIAKYHSDKIQTELHSISDLDKFRSEFYSCLRCCRSPPPDEGESMYANIRQTSHRPTEQKHIHRGIGRASTSFIENINGNTRIKKPDKSLIDSIIIIHSSIPALARCHSDIEIHSQRKVKTNSV